MMILIKYKIVRSLSIWYLLFPFLIFLGTWIRWIISVPCILLLCYGMYRQNKEDLTLLGTVKMPVYGLGLIVIVSALWCWSAGIGGFFYQSPDHQFRNAVFRDLLFYNWPVIYEKYGTGLVYYLGIWIVPAAFGKVLLKWNFSHEVSWNVAEMVLLLWCSIGIVLLVLLFCLYFRQHTVSGIMLLILILIGFSGLDIVGELWRKGLKVQDHIEWWSGIFQFRSNTTALFWAYNQAIPCWLMTMILLSETNVRNYGTVVCCALFYSPLSVIGISLCVFAMAYSSLQYKKERNIKTALYDLFSFQNIVAVITILPILALYYSCNAGVKSKFRFCWEDYGGLSLEMIKIWLVFLILELGVYVCLFIRKEYKNPLVYAMIVSAIFNSIISLGETGEVVYRISATMPELFLLMCFVVNAILKKSAEPQKRFKLFYAYTILVFVLGAFTPAIEYCRAATAIKEQKTICLVADDLKTLDKENAPQNFIGCDIQTSFFYHFMVQARKDKK